MSMSMDELEARNPGPVDYSDFEYDHYTMGASQNGDSTGTVLYQFEPLAEQGGLRPNQLAELVYLEVVPSGVAAESGGGDLTTVEVRGYAGIDLNGPGRVISEDGEGVKTETSGTVDNFQAGSANRPNILVPIRFTTDQNHPIQRRDYRELTGRGPVVDPEDSFDVNLTFINSTTTSTDFQIKVHAIWDVVETDDARSEFAVPDEMAD